MKSLVLPPGDKLGLSRVEAAEYVGVGTNLFDEMVKDGRMPPPRRVNSRNVWSRKDVEAAFENLPFAHALVQTGESAGGEVWDVE